MNILVLGATGFIGSHVTNALVEARHQVICGVRDVKKAKKKFPKCKIIKIDFNRDTNIGVWKNRLEKVDIIINCIGIFSHPNKEILWNIHYYTPKALFEAAFAANVKKIIHISALNTEIYSVDYAKSKKATEDYLLNSGVPAIILKPSLVYGLGASGGMKLFRMLASIPLFLLVPGKGNQKFQPIHVDDITRAILQLIKDESNNNKILSAVSEEKISLLTILKTWRNWLGLSKAYVIRVPLSLLSVLNIINDFIPYSTVNSDSLKMLNQNNIVNREEYLRFQNIIGFTPRNFKEGLLATPSETPDRWYSIFTLFHPVLRFTLAFIWIMSAVTSAFLYPIDKSYDLLTTVGVPLSFQSILLYGASVLNFLMGLALLLNYKTKLNYLLQLVVIGIYTIIITMKLPNLWLEPFGPIAKNVPIIGVILFLYFMERDK